jgi:hypothetical protein
MDVRDRQSQDAAPGNSTEAPDRGARRLRAPSRKRVGEALGEWQMAEVAGAWRYPQCRGLSIAQLEDLYQETVLALLNLPFASEAHLRNALRVGLRNRALHVHRDERRRGEILAAHAPQAHREAVRRSERQWPEQAALAREDGLVVLEFAGGLSTLEQQIYALESEGLRYRAIAPIIGVGVNEAHKVSRELEEKYARFQLLYDTGRLCGYRAPTIRALIAGEQTSEQLARAAFAHLRACAQCRQEHRTNAARLQRSFHERAAALMPIPALLQHGTLAGLWLRARVLLHRLASGDAPVGGGSVRERALAARAGTGASVKVAAGVATVAAVAGGTFSAGSAPHVAAHHHHARRAPVAEVRAISDSRVVAVSTPTPVAISSTPAVGQVRSVGRATKSAGRREPGGFAFLGVPGSSHSTVRASAASARVTESGQDAATASAASTGARAPQAGGGGGQRGGGPFSP